MGSPRRRASKRHAAAAARCTEAIVLAHGFTTDFLVDLIRAGGRTPRLFSIADLSLSRSLENLRLMT